MEYYLGSILMFSGKFAPHGFVPCDGRLLNPQQNMALFSLIGTAYGGDGVNNFAVPDLRGRAIVHRGGTGRYGPSYSIGDKGGFETVQLDKSHFPSHSHALAVNAAPGTATSLAGAVLAGAGTAAHTPTPPNIYGPAGGPSTGFGHDSLGSTGSNMPHPNMQPFLVVGFYIATQGHFPSRH